MVGSGGGVEHPVELSVQLVGGIVFYTFEGKCPSAGYRAQSSSNAPPSPKVSLATVVGNVARLVCRDCFNSSLAFGQYVVQVEISRS